MKKIQHLKNVVAVLRSTIDKIDKGEELISNPEINKIIKIVEKFIKKNKLNLWRNSN